MRNKDLTLNLEGFPVIRECLFVTEINGTDADGCSEDETSEDETSSGTRRKKRKTEYTPILTNNKAAFANLSSLGLTNILCPLGLVCIRLLQHSGNPKFEIGQVSDFGVEDVNTQHIKVKGLMAAGIGKTRDENVGDSVDLYWRDECDRLYRRMKQTYNYWEKKPEDVTHVSLDIKGSPGTGKSLTGFTFASDVVNKYMRQDVLWLSLKNNDLGFAILFDVTQQGKALIFKDIEISNEMTAFTDCVQNAVVFIDGLRSGLDDKTHHKNIQSKFRNKGECLLYSIVSGSNQFNPGQDVPKTTVLSWCREDAEKAWDMMYREKGKKSTDGKVLNQKGEDFEKRYYFAGGSVRHLFRYKIAQIEGSINDAIGNLNSAYDHFELGPGFESYAVSNTLIGVFGRDENDFANVARHMSPYIFLLMKNIASKNPNSGPLVLKLLRLLDYILQNPVVTGFVWEACMSEIVDRSLKMRSNSNAMQPVAPFKHITEPVVNFQIADSVLYTSEDDLVELEMRKREKGVWCIPTRFNNPVWDFIFLNDKAMVFIQCTMAKSHKLNENTIYEFVKGFNSKAIVGKVSEIDVQIWVPDNENTRTCTIDLTKVTENNVKVGPRNTKLKHRQRTTSRTRICYDGLADKDRKYTVKVNLRNARSILS